jgi:uncharacterized membrane protein
MSDTIAPAFPHPDVSRLERLTGWFNRHWLGVFALLYGIFVGLPFLAPVAMHFGWNVLGRGIYFFYSFLCHQLPERSFFLFGAKPMYSLSQVRAAWGFGNNPLLLRQFIGNAQMGWKVAWSDRMVSMYTSILLFGLLWGFFRKRIKSLPWWGFMLLLLPMAIDGTTHFISDLFGIEQGFRQSNLWLVELTHNVFPPGFYAGNALGSFNSWMRLISGLLFGLAVVWFSFPYLEAWFGRSAGDTGSSSG